MQVAAACLAVGLARDAMQYLELWAGALTQRAQYPTPAEAAAAAAGADGSGGSSEAAAGGAAAVAGLVMQKEEALLWATLRMLRDPDTAHGLASAPKVRGLRSCRMRV